MCKKPYIKKHYKILFTKIFENTLILTHIHIYTPTHQWIIYQQYKLLYYKNKAIKMNTPAYIIIFIMINLKILFLKAVFYTNVNHI